MAAANVEIDSPAGKLIPEPSGPPNTHIQPLKQNKHRKSKLLGDVAVTIPQLTKVDVIKYRTSFYHHICLQILSNGYHRAFSEIFSLMNDQEQRRQQAGPDSILWNIIPISEQHEKLKTLQTELCQAENFARQNSFHDIYACYFRLSEYFQEFPDDKWLSDHFYRKVLETSFKFSDDNGFKQAEAYFYLSLALIGNEDFEEAIKNLRIIYEMTMNHKDWAIRSGENFFSMTCENLSSCLTELAHRHQNKVDSAAMYEAKLQFSREALEFAKQSGNKKLEGQCEYRVGMSYEKVGKGDIAVNYLIQFYNLSKEIADDENISLACEAMARAYERQGKYQECIQYLEEFVEVSKRSNQTFNHSRACRSLGIIRNQIGQFPAAVDLFTESFGLARGLNHAESINQSRVLLGMAQSNSMIPVYNLQLELNTRKTLQGVLSWKNTRADAMQKSADPAEYKTFMKVSESTSNRVAQSTPSPTSDSN